MHTITRTRANEQLSGGVQAPLLSADQLVPRVYLAGNTMQHLWRVVSVDHASDAVVLQDETVPRHLQAPMLPSLLPMNTTVAGGLRRQRILGGTEDHSDGILPMRANMPRVHVITPIASLAQPDRFTVYLTHEGSIVTAGDQWSVTLPLIPWLYPAWSLPEPLRSRLP